MSVRSASVALPDRVTVLTCIGCGGMGRQERCDTCSEHELVLVDGADHAALLAAAEGARDAVARLAPVARAFSRPDQDDAGTALARLRATARDALRDEAPQAGAAPWAAPATVTGWWCERCGNVDRPQPCIEVCVWQPAEWVSLARYERDLEAAEPSLRAARELTRFLARAAAATPRAGLEARNREALRAQADAALEAADSMRPWPTSRR